MIKIKDKNYPVEVNNAVEETVDIWGYDIHGKLNWIKVPRKKIPELTSELNRCYNAGREEPKD